MRLPPPEVWLDPGAEMHNPKAMLPTLVRALPRSQPAVGMDVSSLTEEAIGRRRMDFFRYPAYQSELDCLVRDCDGCLRTPSSTEREKLLGYPRDHTYGATSRQSALDRSGKMPDVKCLELPRKYRS
eukprot:6458863-Amphidinium_carterae.1